MSYKERKLREALNLLKEHYKSSLRVFVELGDGSVWEKETTLKINRNLKVLENAETYLDDLIKDIRKSWLDILPVIAEFVDKDNT